MWKKLCRLRGEDEILVYLGGMGVVLLGGNIGLCGGRGGGLV